MRANGPKISIDFAICLQYPLFYATLLIFEIEFIFLETNNKIGSFI